MSGKGAKNYILKLGDKYGYALNTIDKGWIISEIEFDMIKHKSIGFITVRKGDKYGFFAYFIRNGSNISGFHSMDWVESIEKVYISEIIYDNLDKYINGSSEYLLKDGKYGLYIGLESIIPPIYDTVPKFIASYYNNGCKDSLFFLYDVTKNGRHGVMFASYKNTKLIMPIIYKKGEINYYEEGKFLITKKGKPAIIFHSMDSTTFEFRCNENPIIVYDTELPFEISWPSHYQSIINSDSIIYGLKKSTLYSHYNITTKSYNYDTIVYRYILHGYNRKDRENYNGVKTTEDAFKCYPSQLSILDYYNYSVIKEYTKPNCRYEFFNMYVAEMKLHRKSKEKIIVTLYESNSGEFISKFVVKETLPSDIEYEINQMIKKINKKSKTQIH